MASSGSIWVSLGLKTANFSKGIRQAKGQLTGFQKGMAGLKGMFNPFTIGAGLVAGLGVAFADALGKINEFEKANSRLKAILGDSASEGAMMLLSDQAKALGASTAFTANEISSLQTELAKLGFDPTQIKNMTGAVLDLAAASGVELSEAAANAGSILNAFGLQSTDMTHTADVMALSFSSSALDMEDFSEVMKNAAPIAKATGVSLEQASAAAGVLANNGIKGSKAGTDLRRVFSELVKDGKPLEESLEDIAKRMAEASTPAEKLAIAEELVGERAKGALLVLTEQRDKLGELETAFEGADGNARQMADTMLNNVTGSMIKGKSAYEGLVLSIEDGSGVISKSMQNVIDSFTKTLQSITAFNDTDLTIWQRFAQSTGAAQAQLSGLGDKLAEVVSKSKDMGTLEANTTKALANLKLQLDGGVISLEGYKNGLVKIQSASLNTRKNLMGVAEVMPDINNEAKKSTEALKPLTDAEKKAALAARNLTLNLEALKDVKLGNFGEKSTEAINQLKSQFETIEPLELKIPANIQLITEGDILTPETNERITGDMIKLGEDAGAALSASLEGAAVAGLVGIGEAIGSGMGVAEFGEMLIGGFSNLLQSFGEQMIALGVGMIAMQAALALGPLGAGLAIAGGVALVAIAAGIRSTMQEGATGFAEGGMVTSSVFANIGEGRGTTRSNPEVITPLDKLQGMLGMNQGGGEVKFRIEGNQLVGILKRENKTSKFSN